MWKIGFLFTRTYILFRFVVLSSLSLSQYFYIPLHMEYYSRESGELRSIFQLPLLLQNNNYTFLNILVTTLPCKRQHRFTHCRIPCQQSHTCNAVAVLWLLTFIFVFKKTVHCYRFLCIPNLFIAKSCNLYMQTHIVSDRSTATNTRTHARG